MLTGENGGKRWDGPDRRERRTGWALIGVFALCALLLIAVLVLGMNNRDLINEQRTISTNLVRDYEEAKKLHEREMILLKIEMVRLEARVAPAAALVAAVMDSATLKLKAENEAMRAKK